MQNTSINISKFLLEKLFLINNDITDESSWKEVVSDILLATCYKQEFHNSIHKYMYEHLNNEANDEFFRLSERCKKYDFSGSIDVETLNQILRSCEFIKEKYEEQQHRKKQDDIQSKVRKLRSTTLFLRATDTAR